MQDHQPRVAKNSWNLQIEMCKRWKSHQTSKTSRKEEFLFFCFFNTATWKAWLELGAPAAFLLDRAPLPETFSLRALGRTTAIMTAFLAGDFCCQMLGVLMLKDVPNWVSDCWTRPGSPEGQGHNLRTSLTFKAYISSPPLVSFSEANPLELTLLPTPM